MENRECPHCGSPLGSGVAVCGECGKEVTDQETIAPKQDEEKRGRNNVYAILAVFLVVVGGAVLLMFTGLVPNPLRSSTTAAIVNGEKISVAEVNQKVDALKKMSRTGDQANTSSPEGQKMLADMKRQILGTMIQEKILLSETVKEKITVSPQEIADRIASIKKGMNLSDQDFESFLRNHSTTLAAFEKRIEKDLLIGKLIAKGTQEKGLTQDAWLKELNDRAKVEILIK